MEEVARDTIGEIDQLVRALRDDLREGEVGRRPASPPSRPPRRALPHGRPPPGGHESLARGAREIRWGQLQTRAAYPRRPGGAHERRTAPRRRLGRGGRTRSARVARSS